MAFSFWTLFAQSDGVIKCVILLLVLASCLSWFIFLETFLVIRQRRKLSQKLEREFLSIHHSLEKLYTRFGQSPQDPFSVLFKKILQETPSTLTSKEWEKQRDSFYTRVSHTINLTIAEQIKELEGHTSWLASIASTAPFVGLFGTVWGIMLSLQAMATAGDNTLATVAPAISEALFATALGLFVAIPATLFYNRLVTAIDQYQTDMKIFSKKLLARIIKNMISDRL